MEKSQQMGAARSEDRQQGDAARKRPQQGAQQKGAQQQGSQPTQQSGGDASSGQMNSTQFTDWASI